MKTITKWKSDEVFESFQDDHSVLVDGNRKEGVSPKALLLSGLAGCTGIDVVDILKKMKVGFSDFTIEVETEQTTEVPKVFKDINIVYSIAVAPEDEIKVKKAIDLSLGKYCGVSAMLRKHSPINYKLQVLPL